MIKYEHVRTQLLNAFIKQSNYSSYLEIGVNEPGVNFDQIAVAAKTGVDPVPLRKDIVGLTSNAYFSSIERNQKFDLIFIDGLHHWEQVLTDIRNALKHLNKGGAIVCHDMLPDNEEMQAVPRKVISWTGDCWKAWAYLRMTRKDLSMIVLNADHGLGVLTRGRQELFPVIKEPHDLDYAFFIAHKSELMNIQEITV